ncbi:DUF317 domain-containing protein [Streptomyces caeruleatus]|uniref:DUF317 domain-containing protein n=1 Tax=Streptomyces caeruleatus TaxID=661399 RepID=A0A124IA56_9ACTN|nr:DUF317 domain-containing protein [Streptomyces caeruleatus]KUO04640.1 hypothetical protein AQJ67_10605 [Streptomyces caeruleatus]
MVRGDLTDGQWTVLEPLLPRGRKLGRLPPPSPAPAGSTDGRWIRWEPLQGDVGVQFDAFAAQNPHSTLATWTLWSGTSIDRPTWTITASLYTPAALLGGLAETLAHGTGIRTHASVQVKPTVHLTATPTAPPPTAATKQPSQSR